MRSEKSISGCRHDIFIKEKGSTSKLSQDDVAIAEIGREIRFDPSILDTYDYEGWQPVHHDLMLLSAAVEFADRRFARPRNHWCRQFHVTVPVLALEAWQQLDVNKSLTDTLCHLTGDDWTFSFIAGEMPIVTENRQRCLPFGNRKQFAMAYSDGLDSRCVAGIFDKKDMAIRVRVSCAKDKMKKGERPFDLIPFQVKPSRSRESGVRSRGFKFAAITAIAGHVSGVNRIIVPESGQGALGPVLLPLHNVYADYRNHPTFFRKMERFLTALLEYSVTYEQPRLWYTKGQTVSAFFALHEKKQEEILNTRSCWQQRMNVRGDETLRQCGLCAACLLRRMSLHAAGVTESQNVYTFADLSVPNYKDSVQGFNCNVQSDLMVQYGSVGARHLGQLADLVAQPDTVLRRYVFEISQATEASERETSDNLRRLLVQHAEEWHDFVSAQGKKSFLNVWMKGSRYGRSK